MKRLFRCEDYADYMDSVELTAVAAGIYLEVVSIFGRTEECLLTWDQLETLKAEVTTKEE